MVFIDIWFSQSSKNNKIKGTHIEERAENRGFGERKFTGTFENGKIIANIDNKEFFELKVNGKELEYKLTKTTLEDGKEMTFSRNNTMIYNYKNEYK